MSEEAARRHPLAPDRFEQILSVGAVILLGAVVIALFKGYPEWPRVPAVVWPHLITIMIALVLTPVMLLRRRGDRPHRLLGTIWLLSMIATAALSFRIRELGHGGFSPIHLLSAFTLFAAVQAWWGARTHNIRVHRRAIRGLVTGSLLVAGFFTFPFDRLLGHWLFG